MPPFPTPSVPVISVARLINAVETEPAVALRKPEREPREKFEVKRLVEDAVVEKKFVVVADVPVARVNENRGNVDSVVVVAVKWSPPLRRPPRVLRTAKWCRCPSGASRREVCRTSGSDLCCGSVAGNGEKGAVEIDVARDIQMSGDGGGRCC